MKKGIIRRFERVSQGLGRHSALASSHKRMSETKRTVEVVEDARSAPDVGIVKKILMGLFDDYMARFLLGCFTAPFALYFLRRAVGIDEDVPLTQVEVVATTAFGVAIAQLVRVLVKRFKAEHEVLVDAGHHVEWFLEDAETLAETVLHDEDGTASEIVDRRAAAYALEILSAEKALAQHNEHQSFIFGHDIDKIRRKLRGELAIAARFGLGKGQQSYFDAAEVEWQKLALQGKVMTDYCI